MTFCAVCGRKASHHITLTPSLRRNSDYMKQLVKRLKLSTRQADRFTSLPNPHICFRHFADGCVRMVDGRPKIACSKFLKGEVTSFKNIMSNEERRALQVYTEQDNQVNPKSRGIVINCYGRSIVYQEVGPPRKCAICYMVTLNFFTMKRYIPQSEISRFINCFDLGDTPLSEWEESFASKQYVCCHHFPNDVRRSIDGQPKIFDNAILEDGINDSFESDENEDSDLQLKSHKQKKNESTLHEGFNLLSASSLFADKGNSSSTIFQESTSVLPTVSMIQNIKEERVSVSPNASENAFSPILPITTLSNSEPPSKLMNYDMEVEPIKCSLDDVINSVASGALGDSDRKKASLEKLSREAQQVTCSICSRTLPDRTRYLNHMETEHCRDSCEYGYVRRRASTSLYIQDTYTNRSGKPPGYPCPVMGCTQSYVYQNGLYRHLNSVHVMDTYGVGEISGIFPAVWPSKSSHKVVQMMVEDRGIIAAASEIAGL